MYVHAACCGTRVNESYGRVGRRKGSTWVDNGGGMARACGERTACTRAGRSSRRLASKCLPSQRPAGFDRRSIGSSETAAAEQAEHGHVRVLPPASPPNGQSHLRPRRTASSPCRWIDRIGNNNGHGHGHGEGSGQRCPLPRRCCHYCYVRARAIPRTPDLTRRAGLPCRVVLCLLLLFLFLLLSSVSSPTYTPSNPPSGPPVSVL